MVPNDSLSRRELLDWGSQGLAATALAALLHAETGRADDSGRGVPPQRAQRAIHICLVGGLSHIDSFDPKPALDRLHGTKLATDEQPDIFFGQMGLLRKADWAFQKRGQSGLEISELFPHIAELADELTVLRSMESKSANHTPGLMLANSGFEFLGFPSMGSWISYGLGVENESLPAYVVLNDERGPPNSGAATWSSAFLPSSHQGVVFQGGDQPVADLFPARPIDPTADRATREFVAAIDQRRATDSVLEDVITARIKAYELAARMQSSIPAVADLAAETRAMHEAYGLDDPQTADMGRRCLLGRRLLEQGVRFVQVFSGGPIAGSPRASWDAHENVRENHGQEAARIDRPVANSAARPSRSRPPTRSGRAAITTVTDSPAGWPARGCGPASPSERPTTSAGRPSSGRSPGMTFTPRFCICSASITSNSPSITTASGAGSRTCMVR
jgi:hypothetical protein